MPRVTSARARSRPVAYPARCARVADAPGLALVFVLWYHTYFIEGVDLTMKSLAQNARRDKIRQWLAEEGSLRVEDLVNRMSVTSMTIRRDLAAMEEMGVLVRTHGGCTLSSPMVRELSFSEKDSLNARQKAAIARAAAARVKHGAAIFIDTGTTTLHFARALPTTKDLRIFTNNLRVAMELFSRDGFEVNVLGGRLARNSPDLVGEAAIMRAQEFQLDMAVLGTDAVDPVRGETYSAELPTANLDRTIQRHASQVVILADSSKLGKHSLALVCTLAEGVTLVTDDGASPRDITALRRTGAEIVVAPCESDNGAVRK